MRRLLGTIAISGVFAASGAAWACDDVADSHDDSFAGMTKPQAVATVAPAKSVATETKQAAPKADKRSVRAPQSAPTPLKVARTTVE